MIYKIKILHKFVASAGIFLAVANPAGAGAETLRDRSMTRNPWLTFRVSDILIANSIGVNNSGHIAWSPQFKPLGFPIGARLQVGMTAFTTTTSEVFIVPEAQLFAEYPFSPIVTVEVGGGAQYWTQGDVALRSLISMQGNYLLPEAWFKVVRGLFAGISFSPGIVSNWQMRLGADIEF